MTSFPGARCGTKPAGSGKEGYPGGGSVIYGPANVMHGLVDSGDNGIVLLSVQGPKPVKIVFAEHAAVKCPACGQENIVPEGARAGDIVTCPRCGARFTLSKDKDGNWLGTQV